MDLALGDPNGLLAIGGDLSPERLLSAYRQGIFPWYNEGQPILWWSPDPRSVLFPDRLKLTRSLRKTLRKEPFRASFDRAFGEVIAGCAEPRNGEVGTWITADMQQAYERMHRLGYAHSAEAWEGDFLAGGLYGVALGRVFFGESMFSRRSDASKVAFAHLVAQLQSWGYALIDCQVHSGHLESLGAEHIPRREFVALLEQHCALPVARDAWTGSTVSGSSE